MRGFPLKGCGAARARPGHVLSRRISASTPAAEPRLPSCAAHAFPGAPDQRSVLFIYPVSTPQRPARIHTLLQSMHSIGCACGAGTPWPRILLGRDGGGDSSGAPEESWPFRAASPATMTRIVSWDRVPGGANHMRRASSGCSSRWMLLITRWNLGTSAKPCGRTQGLWSLMWRPRAQKRKPWCCGPVRHGRRQDQHEGSPRQRRNGRIGNQRYCGTSLAGALSRARPRHRPR